MNFFEKLEKYSFNLGIVGVFFLPFSISVAQFFLYFSSIGVLILILIAKRISIDKELKKIFFYFLLFYIWIYISNFLQNQYNLKSIQDFFLIFFAFWTYYFINSNYKNKLLNYFIILFFVFIGIGIISSLLPFRLSNLFYHLQNGFFFDGKYRSQHLLFTLPFFEWKLSGNSYPFGLYIPVGFTGTHISFGSILSIISLFFFLKFLKEKTIGNFIVFILFFILILVSHARSALFGFVITIVAIFYFFEVKNRITKKTILSIIFLFFLLIIIYIILPEKIQKILPIYQKHTDYQRIFLWYVSIEVFLKNLIFGTGTLNYQNFIFNEILTIVQKKPFLWYPLYQMEIMHGHNDFVYFLTGSGIIGIFFFLNIFYQKFQILNHSLNYIQNSSQWNIEKNFLVFLFLPIYLLFAGMFQCFFLDDYTMQLYWILYGIALGISNQIQNKRKEL